MIKIGQITAPDPLFGLLIMSGVSTLLIWALGAVRGTFETSWGSAHWLALAGLSQGLGLVFMTFALASGDVVLSTPLIATGPIFGLFYGAVIFRREVLSLRHVATVVLVVLGGALLVTR